MRTRTTVVGILGGLLIGLLLMGSSADTKRAASPMPRQANEEAMCVRVLVVLRGKVGPYEQVVVNEPEYFPVIAPCHLMDKAVQATMRSIEFEQNPR